MSAKTLEARIFGGQLASFERNLLFEQPHAGWVRWIDRDLFVLSKSPFSSHTGSFLYRPPADLRPEESAFVELDVSTPRWFGTKIDTKNGLVLGGHRICQVHSFRRSEPDLPSPSIDKDEFLNRLIWNWRGAEQDRLDFALGMQILSCPASGYGVGGIGSQSFSLGSARKPLDDLGTTIRRLIPEDFLRRDSKYQFMTITTSNDVYR